MDFKASYDRKIRSIRGATTVAANTEEDIRRASVELYEEILSRNETSEISEIVHVMISTTSDLTASYPAKAIREYGCSAPLFSCQEPSVIGALPMCIRMMLTVYSANPVRHTYLHGASGLRPDLKEGED